MDIQEEKEKARRIAIVLILVNICLFLIKWIPTLRFTSISVKADAFNSLGDFAYSSLILLGFEILFRPKDESHPHGHERFEPFISIIVAIAITVTGIMILKDSLQSIYDPKYSFSIFLVLSLTISAGAKYWLSYYLKDKAEELNSTAVLASSEDAKVDVVASSVALVGVLGAWSGLEYADIIFGMIVSIWIFKTAYSIGRENIGYLTGAGAPEEIREKIKEILEENTKALKYHNLEAHYVGPEIHVSVSIHLSKEIDFERVHEVEEKLKRKIESIDEVETVYLHLEPEKNEN